MPNNQNKIHKKKIHPTWSLSTEYFRIQFIGDAKKDGTVGSLVKDLLGNNSCKWECLGEKPTLKTIILIS